MLCTILLVYLDPLISFPAAGSFAAKHSAEHRAKFDFGVAFREPKPVEIRHEQQDQDASLKDMMFEKITHLGLFLNSNRRLTSSSLDSLQNSTSLRATLQDENGTESGSQGGAKVADISTDLDNSKAATVSRSWEQAKVFRNQFNSSAAFREKESQLNAGGMPKKSLSIMTMLFGSLSRT